MNRFGLGIYVLLLCVASAKASAPDWRLQNVVPDPETRTLLVETSLTIRWDGRVPIRLIAYRGTVEVEIEVRDDRGHRLAEVISTGPAVAFQKTVTLQRGQSRFFEVSSRDFTLRHPGTYTATGRLVGELPRGKAVTIDLGELRFTIDWAALKRR